MLKVESKQSNWILHSSFFTLHLSLLFYHSENVALAHHHIFSTIKLDLGTGILAIKNGVTLFENHLLILGSFSCGNNLTTLWFLFCCLMAKTLQEPLPCRFRLMPKTCQKNKKQTKLTKLSVTSAKRGSSWCLAQASIMSFISFRILPRRWFPPSSQLPFHWDECHRRASGRQRCTSNASR